MKIMADKKMVNYYNKRAPEYEQIYYRKVPERRKEIDDEASRLKEIVKGKKVLELACGSGYWTKVMSETAENVTATDISLEMIAEAKKKDFICPVEFIQADMYKLPIEKNSVEFLAIGFWFSHEPKQDYEKYCSMINNLMRPDGQIWMIDNNPPAESDIPDNSYLDENGNNFKKRYLDNGDEYTILKNYFSENEISKILSRYFELKTLRYNKYYWSSLLGPKG